MKYIDELLKGEKVEWLPIGSITTYEQPTNYLVKSANYHESYSTPVLTAGKTFILGYTNEVNGIYRASKAPVIIFDDFTTANKWVDFDFKAKSSAMKMITSQDESKVLLKYIYYWLNTLPNEIVEGDHKRQWISSFCNKRIPIPCPSKPEKSLEIQRKIVDILDKFTTLEAALEAELEAELDCRKRQYEYYRNQLLSFDMLNNGEKRLNNVNIKSLEEIVEIKRGRRLVRKELSRTGRYAVFQNSMTPLGYFDSSNVDGDSTFIISAGAAGEIGYSSVDFWAADDIYYFIPSAMVCSKYLYYFLLTRQSAIKGQVRRASVPRLAKSAFAKIQIPIPSLAQQQRIVSILDKFDTLVNSISEGLPKEIELRRKQYEYYRNQLLSFPEHKVSA